MRIFKNGFSLAEMIICLGLISVIVAMLIPNMVFKKPNKNRALFRKSYYNFERAISELVNDESIFPSVRSADIDLEIGDTSTLFAYFIPNAAVRGLDANKIIIAGRGDTLQERTADVTSMYLCSQIAEHMNTNSVIDCTNSRRLPPDGTQAAEFPVPINPDDNDEARAAAQFSPNFVTNDGVAWFTDVSHAICARELQRDGMFATRGAGIAECNHEIVGDQDLKFPIDRRSDYVCYQIDVNGPENPNCRQCREPDRFRFCVTFDGKIEVPVTVMEEDPETHELKVSPNTGHEAEYLQTNLIIE